MIVCDSEVVPEVSEVDQVNHDQRLTITNIYTWNFAHVATIPDSNYLFAAIAYDIRPHIQQGNRIISEILESITFVAA